LIHLGPLSELAMSARLLFCVATNAAPANCRLVCGPFYFPAIVRNSPVGDRVGAVRNHFQTQFEPRKEAMLVLTRKLQQEIVIHDNIRVTVLEINGSRIRLGITAPDEIAIRRSELPADTKAHQRRLGGRSGNVSLLIADAS
jgi:carbon storage regulator